MESVSSGFNWNVKTVAVDGATDVEIQFKISCNFFSFIAAILGLLSLQLF